MFGIARYFNDLAHDSGGNQNVDSIGPQYNDLTGAVANYDVRFGGVLLDTDPYPASQCPANSPVTNCLTDAQIQQEIASFVTSHHLPTDLSHEYFLLTPPHVESCFSNDPATSFDGCSAGEPLDIAAFCAYHQNTATPTMVFYANMPFDADNPLCQDGNYPNGLISDGEINGGLSHEHIESVTDPIPNDAWTNGAGALHGFEVGDQCVGEMGTPLGTAPQRLAVQPGDQRAPLLVPGGVEQLHRQLRAACDAPQEIADGEGDGHRGQRDRRDVRR